MSSSICPPQASSVCIHRQYASGSLLSRIALLYLSGFAWIFWATIDRSSVTASTSDRTALATALNKHELSSGIMRRTRVPWRSGHHTSGGSSIAAFFLRESDSGADEDFCCFEACWGTCGAAPPCSFEGPAVRTADLAASEDVGCVPLVSLGDLTSLTISCSPFSLTSSSVRSFEGGFWSRDIVFGGYPYLTSYEDSDVSVSIVFLNVSIVAESSRVSCTGFARRSPYS